MKILEERMMKIQMSLVAREQIKRFAQKNCFTQEEMNIFSKLMDEIEVIL